MDHTPEGYPFEHVLENRKAARDIAWDAAAQGDGTAGALFALESMAHAAGLGYMVETADQYRDPDEDDEIRPF